MENAKLIKKIKRLRERVAGMSRKYDGNERCYTFHGGFDYGYVVGQLSILELIADDLGLELDES